MRSTSLVCGLVFLGIVPLALPGAMLPEGMGKWKRDATETAAAPNARVWQEYGFQEGETSAFVDADKKMSISSWRFTDATGAMAAFDTLRPTGAKPTAMSKRSVEDSTGAVIAVGNYVFRFAGLKPNAAELNYLVGVVPRYAASPLPTLPGFVPRAERIPNSERYILGPESLTAVAPTIPPSTVGFHFGAEGELTRFSGKSGKESTLVVFNYPTMEMARDRLPHFQEIPGAVAKRAGPMIAVVLHAGSPDDAERLLSQVKYQAEITVTEPVPTLKDNPGNLFLNVAILVLILAGFCLVSGLAVGGLKYLFRRGGANGDGDPMITLGLTPKQ